MTPISRRVFLGTTSLVSLWPSIAWPQSGPPLDPAFPSHPPSLVQEFVGACHGNVARVKTLVADRPALARASWDWGYGDWETALGAASHVGNREIAELLLAHGAHPTIFSAAMLGQLAVVKALVAAQPGAQQTRGPHGISLLNHAKAGNAAAVVAYLESLGDADPAYPNEALDAAALAELSGEYVFGGGGDEKFVVTAPARGGLMMKREGKFERGLRHHGGRVFNPVGAEAVRIRFDPATGRATSVTILDGGVRVTAKRP
jgi:hypothetical protein